MARRLNPIVAFWVAYVVTRPLGASFADWLGKPHAQTRPRARRRHRQRVALIAFVALVAYVDDHASTTSSERLEPIADGAT